MLLKRAGLVKGFCPGLGKVRAFFPLRLSLYTKWGKISWQRQRPFWEKALKTPCFCCDLAQHFLKKVVRQDEEQWKNRMLGST
jgi:hypothetical protein